MDFLMELNWLAVGQIILIDILLGGDNAIVIALACRNLPAHLRLRGILWGTFGAIAIRVVLIAFAVSLLEMPYIKLVGGILLFWIGTKLLSDQSDHGDIAGSEKLLAAIKTIIVADLVMSLDNVIAIASAAEQAGEHQLLLVIFGILVSIPIIVWGSTLVLRLMQKLPAIITMGAALLGYLAGGMIMSDLALRSMVQVYLPHQELVVPGLLWHVSLPGLVGAIGVVVVGKWVARKLETKPASAQ